MDQLYFESGYIVDGYYTIVREAAADLNVTATFTADGIIAVTTGYFLDDYIAVGYFVIVGEVKQAEAVFSVTVTSAATVTRIIESTAAFTAAFAPTLTAEGIKNSTAVLDSVSTLTVDAVANKAANILLEHIANLNAQAAKTAVVDSTMATTISISSAPTKSVVSSATLASTVTFTCVAFNVTFFDAQFVSTTTIFTSRYLGTGRPRIIVGGVGLDFTTTSKYGSHALYNISNNISGEIALQSVDTIPKANQTWVMEAYLKFVSTTSGVIYFYRAANAFLRISKNTDRTLTIRLIKGAATINITTSASVSSSAFTHVAIVYVNATFSVFLNGTRSATLNLNDYVATSDPWAGSTQILTPSLALYGTNDAIDEWSMHVDTDLGYDPNSTTITVPTEARINDPATTQFLFHFNNNFADDVSVQSSGSAALSTTASVTAQANGNTKSAGAALTSTVTVSANVGKLQNVSAALESTVTQSTAAVKTVQALANVTANVSVTVTAFRIKEFASNQNVLFTPTLTVTAQLAGVALLETDSLLTVSAVKTTDVVSEQNTTATLTATITGNIRAVADLTVIVTQNTAVERTRTTESALVSAFTHTVLDTLFKGHSADLSVSATVTAEVIKLKIAVVNITLTAATVISAEKTTDVTSTHIVSTDFTADNLRVRFADSTQSTQFNLTTVPVLTSDPVIVFNVQALQVTDAVKTADSAIIAVSLFTPSFDVDFITRPQVFFETQSTVSAIIGSIKQATNITSTGLQITDNAPYIDNLSGMPFFGLKVRSNTFTASIWARRESTPSTLQPLWSSEAGGALVFNGTDLMLRFNFDPDEPNAVWTNVVPTDGEWHQYLIRTVNVVGNEPNTSNPGAGNRWQLWIDGEFQGESSLYQAAGQIEFNNGGRALLGHALIRDLTGGYELNGRRLTGAIAQVWMGFTTDSQFNPELFSNPGFVDFGSTGNLGGLLPTPLIYNPLQTPFTGITGTGLTTATTPLSYSPTVIRATTLITANAVSLVISNQLVVASISAAITYQVSPTVALSTSSTFSCQVTQFTGIIADVTSTVTAVVNTEKITGYTAAVTSTATIQIVAGFFENAEAAFAVTAEVICDFDNIPPTRGEADLFSAFTVTADANSFTDSTTLTVSAFALVCDATLIPPIRATANLTTTATLTAVIGSIEQFAALTMSAGTMTITAQKTTGIIENFSTVSTATVIATQFKGIILNLSAFNSILTVGEVINLDPYLTYVIPAETRLWQITAESRIIAIEQETRVNIV